MLVGSQARWAGKIYTQLGWASWPPTKLTPDSGCPPWE